MSTERLKTFLEPLDEVVSLIAAVVHDVDHPGKTRLVLFTLSPNFSISIHLIFINFYLWFILVRSLW